MDDSRVSEAVLSRLNLATQITCISLCTIFVALRFFVQYYFLPCLGIEDYCCFIAWIFFTGYCSLAIALGPNGAGYYAAHVSEEQMVTFRKLEYCITILYGPAVLFVKFALLFMIARVFSPFKYRVYFIYTFLVCLCCYYFAVILAKALVCIPVSAYWEPSANGVAKCVDQRGLFITDCVVGLVTDSTILILPLPLTWALHMSRAKKLRVAVLLGAGGVATLFSLYRLVILFESASQDPTRLFTRLALTGSAEIATGLICACLPAANIFITHFKWQKDSNQDQSSLRMKNLRQLKAVSSHSEGTRFPSADLAGFDMEPCRLTTSAAGPHGSSIEAQSATADDEQASAGIQVNVTVMQTIESLGLTS